MKTSEKLYKKNTHLPPEHFSEKTIDHLEKQNILQENAGPSKGAHMQRCTYRCTYAEEIRHEFFLSVYAELKGYAFIGGIIFYAGVCQWSIVMDGCTCMESTC